MKFAIASAAILLSSTVLAAEANEPKAYHCKEQSSESRFVVSASGEADEWSVENLQTKAKTLVTTEVVYNPKSLPWFVRETVGGDAKAMVVQFCSESTLNEITDPGLTRAVVLKDGAAGGIEALCLICSVK